MKKDTYLKTLLAILAIGSFAGCGGGVSGSNLTNGTSITITDPYIEGATVYWDKNNNNTYDIGEPLSSLSDSNGKATFSVVLDNNATLIMKDKGTHNGVDYNGSLMAQYNKNGIISPLTTLEAKGFSKAEIVTILDNAGITITEDDIISDPMKGLTQSTTSVTDNDIKVIRASIAVNTFFSIYNFDSNKTTLQTLFDNNKLNDAVTLAKNSITPTLISTHNADYVIKASVSVSNYVCSKSTETNTSELTDFVNDTGSKLTSAISSTITKLTTNGANSQVKLIDNGNGGFTTETIFSVKTGFTNDYLNGKTLYGVLDWRNDEDKTWVLTEENFKNSTHEFAVLFPVANQAGIETESYTITSNGSLKLGDGIFYWHLMAIDNDKLTLCASSNEAKPSSCSGNDITEYFFFDQTKAETFLETKKTTAPTITVESGFSENYLNSETLYGVLDWRNDEDKTWVLTEENFKNSTHEFNVLLPVANQAGMETEPYTITSSGSLKLDTIFYWHLMAIDNDKLTLCASSNEAKPSSCSGNDITEYFFFDKTKAETALNQFKAQ